MLHAINICAIQYSDHEIRIQAMTRDFVIVFLGKTLYFHSASLHPGV